MFLNVKKGICIAALCCILTVGSAEAAKKNYYSIDNIRIYNNISKIKITPEYIKDVEELVYRKSDEAKFTEAEKAVDYLVKLNTKLYGQDSVQTAKAYLTEVSFYTNLAIYDKAKENLDKAERISKLYSDDAPLQNELKKIRFEYYLSIFQPYDNLKILNTTDKYILNEQKYVLAHFDQLSSIYLDMKDFDKTEEFFTKYYNRAIDVFGADNEYLLQYYQGMLYLSEAKSDYYAFNTYFPKAEEQYTKVFEGNLHQLSRNIIAKVAYYNNISDYNAAKELLDKYYPTFEQANNILDTQNFLNYYIAINKDAGYYDKAEKYIIKLDNLEAKLPVNSLKRLNGYEKKFDVYKDSQQYLKAEAEVNKALKLIEPVKEYVPYIYGKFLQKAGIIQSELKNNEASYTYFEKALAEYKKSFPEISYTMYEFYKDYGEAYERSGNHCEALEKYSKAYNIAATFLGKSSEEIAELSSLMANSYVGANDKKKAISSINNSVKLYKKIYGQNHIKAYEKLNDKYHIYSSFEMKGKAEKLLTAFYNDAINNRIKGDKKEVYFNLFLNMTYNALENGNCKAAEEYLKLASNNVSFDRQQQELNEIKAQMQK